MSVANGLLATGAAAATGNYVGAAIGLLGVGVSLFGASKQSEDARKYAALGQQENAYEQQVQDQKQIAMQLSGRRQQLEIIRNSQRQRAQGAQAGISQGAQYGSGYAGGQAEEQAMGFYNLKGVNDNLQIGQNIFDINKKISGVKSQMIGIQSDMSTDAGISALGAGISKSADPLARLSGQFFSSSSGGNPYDSMPRAGIDF